MWIIEGLSPLIPLTIQYIIAAVNETNSDPKDDTNNMSMDDIAMDDEGDEEEEDEETKELESSFQENQHDLEDWNLSRIQYIIFVLNSVRQSRHYKWKVPIK